LPFWHDRKDQNYFDGCLRDQKQGRLTYRYVLRQSLRHGVCDDWRDYPHTRVNVELERAIKRALELNAFLVGVPYKRYDDPNNPGTPGNERVDARRGDLSPHAPGSGS
jgi:hypothetical protein